MTDTRSDWQRRIGVGEQCHALPSTEARKPTRRRYVTAEEGPQKGTISGYHTDHHDGRIDATVMPATVTSRPSQGDSP